MAEKLSHFKAVDKFLTREGEPKEDARKRLPEDPAPREDRSNS